MSAFENLKIITTTEFRYCVQYLTGKDIGIVKASQEMRKFESHRQDKNRIHQVDSEEFWDYLVERYRDILSKRKMLESSEESFFSTVLDWAFRYKYN